MPDVRTPDHPLPDGPLTEGPSGGGPAGGPAGGHAVGDDLALLPATEALRLFRRRELSPVELMQAVIDRGDATEGVVNAFTVRYPEQALAAARVAAGRYVHPPAQGLGALEGLAVGVKEEMYVAGQPCTSASTVFRDEVADHGEPVTDRILAAGGIVHARTSMPEFACAPFTHSRLFGVTRNPWNPLFSPGGSSGGAAASLAVGSSTLAPGSDIGGSIRMPASACGVVGYKPPYGRVPVAPPYNLDTYCHNGPLARTVADCALLYGVLAGPHPDDPTVVPDPPVLQAGGATAHLRVGYSPDLNGYPVEAEVRAVVAAAAAALGELGSPVRERTPGWSVPRLVEAAMIHFGATMGSDLARAMHRRDELMPYTLDMYDVATTLARAADPARPLQIEAEAHAHLAEVFADVDVLICPTLPFAAFRADDDHVQFGPEIAGSGLHHVAGLLPTIPFNLCSRNPVVTVPFGVSATGVPVGVQVVGRPFDERTVFAVAAALELVRPWRGARPGLLAATTGA